MEVKEHITLETCTYVFFYSFRNQHGANKITLLLSTIVIIPVSPYRLI